MAVTTGRVPCCRSSGNILVLEVVLARLYAQCPTIYCFCSFYSIVFNSGVASYGALGHVPPTTFKSESQLSKYCVVCEIS